MDEVLKAVKERRSIRSFLKKDIPEELVKKIIEALIWAPSAGNLQARKFYLVKNQEIKIKLAYAALSQMFIAEAPLVIVGCIDKERIYPRYGERGVSLYAIQDVACSINNAMLVAHENALGTVWVGAFREEEVSKILKLPKNLRPVVILPVGYPAHIPTPPPRVSIREALEFIE
ncbi:MAG: nitroreductase family protein [Thermodesulfovibrio sp.]|nr:nitroreductase family protein [Thermodesulfovibrio sp.]MDW7998503.1 nitroreductase family protein [Thermodesulfovibrio sp.]